MECLQTHHAVSCHRKGGGEGIDMIVYVNSMYNIISVYCLYDNIRMCT